VTDLHDDEPTATPNHGAITVSAVAFAGFIAILLVVSLSGGRDPFDSLVTAQAARARGADATVVARIATALGSLPAVVTVTALAVVALWLKTRQLWSPMILGGSVAVTAGLVTLIKIAVGRTRPDATGALGAPALDFAFPSGHTTDGSLVYVLAALMLTNGLARPFWRRLAVGAAVLLALLIGLSRIYLGYHWATDVLGGWLLATGVVASSCFTSRALALPDGLDPSHETASLHREPLDRFVR
jgi:membrane-associated phospholipid phosphatase